MWVLAECGSVGFFLEPRRILLYEQGACGNDGALASHPY